MFAANWLKNIQEDELSFNHSDRQWLDDFFLIASREMQSKNFIAKAKFA